MQNTLSSCLWRIYIQISCLLKLFSQSKCRLNLKVYYKCQVWTSLRWVSGFRTRICDIFFLSLSFNGPQAWRFISLFTFSISCCNCYYATIIIICDMSGPAMPVLITTSSCKTLLSLWAIIHSDITLAQTFSHEKCPLDFKVYYKRQVWTSLRWVSRFCDIFFWSLSFIVPQAWRVISPFTFSTSSQFPYCYVTSFRANVAKKLHRKTFQESTSFSSLRDKRRILLFSRGKVSIFDAAIFIQFINKLNWCHRSRFSHRMSYCLK